MINEVANFLDTVETNEKEKAVNFPMCFFANCAPIKEFSLNKNTCSKFKSKSSQVK